VGHSTAVKCLDQAALSHYYFDVIPAKVGTPAWVNAQLASQAAFVKGCVKNTGALLAYMDTLSAARDLDVVRVALGEKKLDYFGVSYGTRLGLVYAGLFPKNVGRFVLDGIDDPGLTG
ncbi:alpha/beta fold hydrolase, partial [Paenibacillus sp. TAF58]